MSPLQTQLAPSTTPQTSSAWSPFGRQLAIILLILGFLMLISILKPVFSLLVWTGIVIFILHYPVELLKKKFHLPNFLSVLIVFAPIVYIIASVSGYLLQEISQDLQAFSNDLQNPNERMAYLVSIYNNLSSSSLGNNVLARAAVFLREKAGDIFSIATYLWTTLFLSFLYLIEVPTGNSNSFGLIPEANRLEFSKLFTKLADVWEGWLKSTAVVSFYIGVVTYIQLYLMGVPYAKEIGIIAGLLNLIPTLGPLLTYLLIIVVTYTMGSTKIYLDPITLTFFVLLINVLLAQFGRLYLFPKLAGKSAKLPIFSILLAIIVASTIWGVLGIILSVPLLGTLSVILKYMLQKIAGNDPFPGEESQALVEA